MEAIILRTFPFGESDIIVRALTKERGKLSCIAKYARKSKKRFFGSIEIFDSGRITVKEGKGDLKKIESFNSHSKLWKLRENLSSLNLASLLCEAYDHVIKEEQSNKSENSLIFEILNLGLEELTKTKDLKTMFKISHLTLVKLLENTGYQTKEKIKAPSMNNFKSLIYEIEKLTERELASKEQVYLMFRKLEDG